MSIKNERVMDVVYLSPVDFMSICRTCLSSEKEFVDIFTKGYDDKSISHLLSSCTDFEVSEQDGLPKQVCVLCVSQLHASYSFREKSRKNNELLLCALADFENKTLTLKKEKESVNLTDYFVNFEEIEDDINLENLKAEKWENVENDISKSDVVCDSLKNDYQNVKRKSGRPRKYQSNGTGVKADGQTRIIKNGCNICLDNFPPKRLLTFQKCKHYTRGCGKCKNRYRTLQDLRSHKCEIASIKSPETSKPEVKEDPKNEVSDKASQSPTQRQKSLICNICNREYKCARSLQYHLRSHTGEKPALCSWCGKSFREERGLFNHITTMHTKEKRFKCSFCPKAFPVSGKRRQHERIHTGEKPYQCELCNRLFAARTTLSAHVRRHTGEIKFRCTFDGCGIGFYAFSTYQRHTWKHTGKRPYPCEQCTKSYLSRQNLRSHVKSAHTRLRDEVCHVCGKMYSEKSVLNRHLRQIHSVEPKD